MKTKSVSIGTEQISILLRLVRLEMARAESLNQKLESYKLAGIECCLKKAIAPSMTTVVESTKPD